MLIQILIKKYWRSFAWRKGDRPGQTSNHATNHASQAVYLTNHASQLQLYYLKISCIITMGPGS